MHHVHRQRLKTLATFLKRSKRVKDHFNLYGWLSVNGRYEYFPSGGLRPDTFTNECGSTACACGWGGTIPSLRRQGFSVTSMGPRYKNLESWHAVEAFFGLSTTDSEELFMSANYAAVGDRTNDAHLVADRIFEFLKYA